MKKFFREIDLNIMWILFLLICLAELSDFLPDFNFKIWASRLCGLLMLISVVFTAREGIFITMNAFLNQKLKFVSDIVMALTYIFIEVALFSCLKLMLMYSRSSEATIWLACLHIASIIIYLLSFIFLIRNIFKNRKGA